MTLSFERLSVTLGARTTLDDASLSVEKGEFVAVLGPNGAGKTTLLRAGLGLIPAAAGRTSIAGASLAAMSLTARAKALAYLPQARAFGWPVTAKDAVSLGRFAYGSHPGRLSPDDEAAVSRAARACDIEPLLLRRVDTLSGGEAARVHLARMLCGEAPYLLADEPVQALDPAHQLRILEVFRSEAEGGKGVAVTLHDLDLAAQFASRVVLMAEGRLVAEGTPGEVLTKDRIRSVYGIDTRIEGGRILPLRPGR